MGGGEAGERVRLNAEALQKLAGLQALSAILPSSSLLDRKAGVPIYSVPGTVRGRYRTVLEDLDPNGSESKCKITSSFQKTIS